VSHPIRPDRIDSLIHERVRLSIVSTLALVPEMSFGKIKKNLSLTDGNLSAHSRKLEEAGYIEIEKSFQDRKPHTVMRLTNQGRKAYKEYLEMLKSIIDQGMES
jgi:DNA-binding MarR family transcriptional regulator